MATETVDIRFRETGARVIKRRIDEMGQAANNATRGIFLMQRAIFVLGGAGAIRALSRQVDMLTNYENRLRLTATSAENLEEVQRRLFQVARDSRSSFESVAEIYTRTALSVRELGISQQETIRFSESLSKATIISGASSREAHAAMVQLGQGMASNTLRGDELRSVLEQLPFVADVIGRHFGVTRGELRRLGEEGKISAEEILAAFRKAEKEIDTLFAQTIPTISQALTVANTNWLQFLDNIDDTTSASAHLANIIILISRNINVLVGSLAALAGAFAFAFTIKMIQRVSNWITSLKVGAVTSARLLEVENRRAHSAVAHFAAQSKKNAAGLADIRIGVTQLQQGRAILLQDKAETAVIFEGTRARSALTGQFVSLAAAKANLARINKGLWQTEIALRASSAQLAASTTAQAGATNALAAAQTRLGTAQAASGTLMAKATRTFPLIAGGIGLVVRGFGALWGLLAANPIGAVVAVIGLAVVALFQWGNAIKVTEDGVVGLKDVTVAAFELMTESVEPFVIAVAEDIGGAFEIAVKWVLSFGITFNSVLIFLTKILYNFIVLIPRLFVSVIAGIIEAWNTLPKGIGDIFTLIINETIKDIEVFANNAITIINGIISAYNAIKIARGGTEEDTISLVADIDLNRLKNDYNASGKTASEAFLDGFQKTFNATSFDALADTLRDALGPLADALIQRAREDIAAAEEAARRLAEIIAGAGAGKATKVDPEFAKLIDRMRIQIKLLKLSNEERRVQSEIVKLEKSLKRDLTKAEEGLATAVIRNLNAAKDQAAVLTSITGPRDKAMNQMIALNQLYIDGRIGIDDYTNSLKKMREAMDAASGTFMGSFKAAISSAVMDTSELGDALGKTIVSAAGNASDAIVKFAQTGKINIRDFFAELFAQLMKLLTQQILLQLLTGIAGGGAGVTAQSVGGGGPSFASGGSIMPSGPGSTDTQQIFFNKRPDERVDILTPSQQKAQRRENGGGDRESRKEGDITIINVDDPNRVLDALSTTKGERVLMNMMQRNRSAFRKALSI